ncbi:hypothetical protein [Levilactobacillus zymae]|uniref:hypothetical protein n=1 Tax=Levilactobacillus zymae TaxID=267363 RepID=UPI0028B2B629|nr:hypothetical protein [Levilactobacillus zymae]MDT6979298.1 hypothetical protein [Levilactobacillus zymae]
MTELHSTTTPLTPADFWTPERLARLSSNQQTHAAQILTDFYNIYQQVTGTRQAWTPTGVTAALTALPLTVEQPHNYFVAVVPVLSEFFKVQTGKDWPAFERVLKAARPQLVEKHTTAKVNQEQHDYENVVAEVEGWVQDMRRTPQVANLTASDQRHFGNIVHVVTELLVTGKHLQPVDWQPDNLAAVMFGPFTHLLDESQRVAALYHLIPFALTHLFDYLEATEEGLLHAQALRDWVREHHTALVTMYDPKMEAFFEQVTTAMQKQGIDTQDKAAVDRFTQQYLRTNPELGRELFATDAQLKAVKRRGHRPAFSRKHRRRR